MRTGIKNFLISFIKNNMRNSDHATTIFVLVLLLFVAFIYLLDHLPVWVQCVFFIWLFFEKVKMNFYERRK